MFPFSGIAIDRFGGVEAFSVPPIGAAIGGDLHRQSMHTPQRNHVRRRSLGGSSPGTPGRISPPKSPMETLSSAISISKCKIHPRSRERIYIYYDSRKITHGQKKALRRLSNPANYSHNTKKSLKRGSNSSSSSRSSSVSRRRSSTDSGDEILFIALHDQAEASGLGEFDLLDLQTRDLTPEDYELLCQLDDKVQKPTLESNTIDKFELKEVTEPVECGVCLSEVDAGSLAKVLPCGHPFHPDCIKQWLTSYSTSCPFKCSLD